MKKLMKTTTIEAHKKIINKVIIIIIKKLSSTILEKCVNSLEAWEIVLTELTGTVWFIWMAASKL